MPLSASGQRGAWAWALLWPTLCVLFVFATTFRQYEPTLPAAMTTFGAAKAPWVLPIDFASWRDNGFDLLPQAYYNQFPKVDRPDMTVAHAQRPPRLSSRAFGRVACGRRALCPESPKRSRNAPGL